MTDSRDRARTEAPQERSTEAALDLRKQAEQLRAEGRFADAYPLYQESALIEPLEGQYLHGYADVLFELNDWPEAAKAYRQALATVTNPDWTYFTNNMESVSKSHYCSIRL